MRKFTAPLVLLVVLALYVSKANAADSRVITETYDVSELERLELDISVAEMDIEVYEGDQVELEILLEGERRFFGLSREDVDDVELEQDVTSTALYLGIDERNIDQHWIMRVPSHLAMRIDLGIGDVHVEHVSNAVTLDIGVGAVRLDVIEGNIGEIWLDVGVGEVSIRGMEQRVDNERNFISDGARYFGPGEHNIRVEMGVGDIQVRGE